MVVLAAISTLALADPPDLPQDLVDIVGERRVLGYDYAMDEVPSTSDCIGSIDTASCAIDTLVACLEWRMEELCNLVGKIRGPFDHMTVLPPDHSNTLHRNLYMVAAVEWYVRNKTPPWPQAHDYLLQRRWPPLGYEEVSVHLKVRFCERDRACMDAMGDVPTSELTACIQTDVCTGGADHGVVLARTEAGWIVNEFWLTEAWFGDTTWFGYPKD